MSKVIKKLLTTAGIVASGAVMFGMAAYATTASLVKMALDREEPEIMKKSGKRISGNEDTSEFEEEYTAAAQVLNNSDLETVKITARDGITLEGHFYQCDTAKRVIIAFHGWRSSWYGDFGLIAEFWNSNNCSVLYVEQRGQNNSGGDYMGFGLIERYDCVDWANWVVDKCGEELPIYLAGISMGATTVLMAADLDLPNSVHGIMADCGFTSPKEIWKHVAQKNLHIPYNFRGIIADSICKQKINMRTGDCSTLESLAKTNIPVLFVHGTDDKFVPIDMTYQNYKACTSPKRLLVVPGANHAMSYCVERAEYQKTVLGFWHDFDTRQIKNVAV